MSDCGCATPPPPAEYPIASSDCACGLPDAFRAAQTYAEETNAKLARLWPYSEMYGPILRGLRRARGAGQPDMDEPEYSRRPSFGSPMRGLDGLLNDGEDHGSKLVLDELPDAFYQPPYGADLPSASGCEGWRYLGLAAPLLDPLAGTVAGCTAKAYLRWWLSATSPATLSLEATKRRIYVHNVSLASSVANQPFPTTVQDSLGAFVNKFSAEAA